MERKVRHVSEDDRIKTLESLTNNLQGTVARLSGSIAQIHRLQASGLPYVNNNYNFGGQPPVLAAPGGDAVAASAEDGQEVNVEDGKSVHLYGEVVMQFHVKPDDFHREGEPSGIVVTRPPGSDGKPWRPVVCRWYVEKGPVDVRGDGGGGGVGGGSIEWKPYNPK